MKVLAVAGDGEEHALGVIPLGDLSHAPGRHDDKAAGMLMHDVMSCDIISCSQSAPDAENLTEWLFRSDARH